MTGQEALEFLGRLRMMGMKLGLENMRDLAERIGGPHERMRFIHIAGTNGKGSTSAFLASCLRKAGYRVGMFTSPHLISICERIQINGVPISMEELTEGVETLQPILAQMAAPASASDDGGNVFLGHPTFFEVMTALALWYFERSKADWVVWETGLGGRFDATNIVTPECSVITSIAMDHATHLGNTLALIAGEKAGIIKPGVPVVSGVLDPEALEVIRRKADELDAPFEHVSPHHARNLGIVRGRQRTRIGEKKYSLGLLGPHQVRNAACALATLQLLRKRARCFITDAMMTDGLAEAVWPGRFQVLRADPPVVVDGAHNPDAVQRLVETWQSAYRDRRCVLVCGFLQDKSWDTMAPMLGTLADEVFVVGVSSARSSDPFQVAGLFGHRSRAFANLGAAWEEIQEIVSAAERPVLVAGSLFLVGEFLARREGSGLLFDLNEHLEPMTEAELDSK
ncbi:MAG: folylpolyglutamate synthase/dihydrofolate synthase family protein [Candidatus Methylacidiphilales bacterium]|nr:folylpolyglutamate synthase/dihydrofolate synthase family protein [Candidatus Methylacidiphilales bacterium]